MTNKEELKNKCLECSHSGLCKYQEKYNEIFKTIKIYEQPFEMVLNCQHFSNKGYEELIPKAINITPPLTAYRSQCEGCHIYEDIKKGKLTVNDACSFCANNPYKLTTKC